MEANTNQRKWFIPCCEDKECHLCNGTGQIFPIRCPVYYYKDLKTLRYLYENYKHKNILPFNGSPIEQPKVLIDCFDLIDHYLYVIEKNKRERQEEVQEVASRIMKGKKNGR